MTLTFRLSKGGDASASQMQPTTAFEASPQKRQIEAKFVDSTASEVDSTAACSSSGGSVYCDRRASVAGTRALLPPPPDTLALPSPPPDTLALYHHTRQAHRLPRRQKRVTRLP